jgi:hypothetical protein
MQQSCTCGSVRGASGQLASLPRPLNPINWTEFFFTRLEPDGSRVAGSIPTGGWQALNRLARIGCRILHGFCEGCGF